MVEGTASYVLPRYENKIYVMLEVGEHFGHVDLAIMKDMLALEVRLDARALKRKNLVRRFTVQAIENCETFVLRIDDLEKMKMEFPDMFVELFEGAHEKLQKELLTKLDVIKKCEAQSEAKTDLRSKLATIFNYGNAMQGINKVKQERNENQTPLLRGKTLCKTTKKNAAKQTNPLVNRSTKASKLAKYSQTTGAGRSRFQTTAATSQNKMKTTSG